MQVKFLNYQILLEPLKLSLVQAHHRCLTARFNSQAVTFFKLHIRSEIRKNAEEFSKRSRSRSSVLGVGYLKVYVTIPGNFMKRILILHRNVLFRDCLTNYLRTIRNDDAVSVDHTQANRVEDIVADEADLILLDLNLPDNLAIDLVKAVSFRDVKVLLLVPSDHQSLVECIAEGVSGCVLEQSTLEGLKLAIESVLLGETFCCPKFAKTMFSELSKAKKISAWQIPDSGTTCRLTSRERQVLQLIAERQCNKEIAKALSLSLFTIKNHVHNILKKLNVENRVEAVVMAQQENLLHRH